LVALLAFAVVWLLPLVAVTRRHQWSWCLAIFFFGPVAAAIWLICGRTQHATRTTFNSV
jgi:hypothetical protein